MAPHELASSPEDRAILTAKYGLDRTSQPTKVVEKLTDSGNGFDWGDFGIGAAAMLGLVLLSGGLLAGAYFGRKMACVTAPSRSTDKNPAGALSLVAAPAGHGRRKVRLPPGRTFRRC